MTTKTITVVDPDLIDVRTFSAGHTFTVYGETPGGKHVKVQFKLNNDHFLGCVARRVHHALRTREEELARIRKTVETGQ